MAEGWMEVMALTLEEFLDKWAAHLPAKDGFRMKKDLEEMLLEAEREAIRYKDF